MQTTDLMNPLLEKTEDQSQEQWIRYNLSVRKFITRNECLKNFVTRLAARITDLKDEGWNIEGESVDTQLGKDYVYYLK